MWIATIASPAAVAFIFESFVEKFTECRKGKMACVSYHGHMNAILSIATSGMTAATRRLEVSASNVANARSDGPLPSADAAVQAQYPEAYKPLRVDQVETSGGGTFANVRHDSPSHVRNYDPGAPYADDRGMVASPNVDFANEVVQSPSQNFNKDYRAFAA